jgi:hypothetical protein
MTRSAALGRLFIMNRTCRYLRPIAFAPTGTTCRGKESER